MYDGVKGRTAFERAHALSADFGQPLQKFQAIYGLWGHHWMAARHHRAIELGKTLLAEAERSSDQRMLSVTHRALGCTLFTQGDFVAAREHLQRAIALAPPANGERLNLVFAVHPRIAALLVHGWNAWVLGYPDLALDNALQALGEANISADPYSTAFAHYVTSAVRLLRGEFEQSREHADLSLAISIEHRINLYELYSRFGRGCALLGIGGQENGISEIREGIEEARRSKLGYMQGFMSSWLATAQLAMGEPETALVTINGALSKTSDDAGRAWEAELLRLRGESLLMVRPGDADRIERIFWEAIKTARRQSARALELRAATSLTRLLQIQGRDDQARTLLKPIYDSFTEGFHTMDLREARTWLNRLQA